MLSCPFHSKLNPLYPEKDLGMVSNKPRVHYFKNSIIENAVVKEVR